MFGEIEEIPRLTEPDSVSLYRTRWLVAHNYLHDLIHKGGDPQTAFDGYLREVATAAEIASQAA